MHTLNKFNKKIILQIIQSIWLILIEIAQQNS